MPRRRSTIDPSTGFDRRYEGWSKSRRVNEAVHLVTVDGLSVSEAARRTGVSRQWLSTKLNRTRNEADDKLPVVRIRRRMPETFGAFADWYFAGWNCPDCERPHARPPFHDEIIAAVEDPDCHRLLINVPPYSGKTTLLAVQHTIYKLVTNPNHRRIIVSESWAYAKDICQQVIRLLSDESLYPPDRNLIADWGPFLADEHRQDHFWLRQRTSREKDPSLLAIGIGAQIYGRRADDIVCDDVATLKTQTSAEQVAKQLQWLQTEAVSRIGRSGKLVVIGTRLAPGDLYWHLARYPAWKVIRYPMILDEERRQLLWPDHVTWSYVERLRGEMDPRQFQLVYQNNELPGADATFLPEDLEAARDDTRTLGHFDPHWVRTVGVDLGGPTSGRTSFVVLAADPTDSRRYLIDWIDRQGMKAPEIRDTILTLVDRYDLAEVRVESNALQAQIVQYNDEITRPLASRGVRVVPHVTTGRNKWDSVFGVESLAPLFTTRSVSVPWASPRDREVCSELLDQFMTFPLAARSDGVMAFWIAELSLRDLLRRRNERRATFDDRWVPERIKRRRCVVRFSDRTVVPWRPETPRFDHPMILVGSEVPVNVSPDTWACSTSLSEPPEEGGQ